MSEWGFRSVSFGRRLRLFSLSLYLSDWLASSKHTFNTFIIFDRDPVVSAL